NGQQYDGFRLATRAGGQALGQQSVTECTTDTMHSHGQRPPPYGGTRLPEWCGSRGIKRACDQEASMTECRRFSFVHAAGPQATRLAEWIEKNGLFATGPQLPELIDDTCSEGSVPDSTKLIEASNRRVELDPAECVGDHQVTGLAERGCVSVDDHD